MALPVAAALASKAIKNRPKVRVGNITLTVLLAGGLGAATFFGIRAISRRFTKDIRQGQALNQGSPESFAVSLIMAFENDNSFGWGTNEELLFRTLELVPNAVTMRKVQSAFRDLDSNQRNLAAALQSELSSEEYAVALEIINSKT